MYFYIQNNKDWIYENKVKYGITNDYKTRLKTDQHSYKCEYISLYKYEINDKYKLKYKEIDNIFSKQRNNKIKNDIKKYYPSISFENLFNIKEYLINQNGGKEFIKKDGLELLEKILLNDFKKIGIDVYKIPKEEWNIENENDNDENENDNENDNDENDENDNDDNIIIEEVIDDTTYIQPSYQDELRDYQKIIIDEGLSNIKKDGKVYISLATGGGKSFISFKILNEIVEDNSTIIILTPRINICNQNLQIKYLKLLDYSYKIYDKNNLEYICNHDNNLICCCINSYKKVMKAIINADLRNVVIWFDEAHHTLDNWIIKQDEEKDFLLKDDKYIKYRIYTSASPNKDFVIRNNKIFGEFVNPIKIRDLINEGYLCKLNTYIYKDEIYEDNINNKSFVNFIIENCNDKKFGLCFTNSCENALELFNIHLNLFRNDNSLPKPFLLINSGKLGEYRKNYKIFNEDNELFKLETFENDGGYAYIVNMYAMGYDNPKIDLLIFKDKKKSYKDIIQSIGRGTRPYGNKETDIIIPVKNFNKINENEILKYLISEFEFNMKDINLFKDI